MTSVVGPGVASMRRLSRSGLVAGTPAILDQLRDRTLNRKGWPLPADDLGVGRFVNRHDALGTILAADAGCGRLPQARVQRRILQQRDRARGHAVEILRRVQE